MECHLKWNVIQSGMSLKIEFFSQNGLSLKTECCSQFNVTQNEMSLKIKCH